MKQKMHGLLYKKTIYSIMLILFVWINSGSMFQAIYPTQLQRLICLICAVLIALEIKKKKTVTVGKDSVGVFLVLIAVVSMACMLEWLEFSQIILYFSNFSVFYICYFIVRKIDMQKFMDVFLTFITVIAVTSLIGWYNTDILLGSPLGAQFSRYMSYKSFFFFNIITDASSRNSGAFWEPGMFQGFLNFAILLTIMKEKIGIKDLVRIVVFSWAVVTTYSTTGYIVLITIFIFSLYRRIHVKFKMLADIILVTFVLFFIIADGATVLLNYLYTILPSEITWKIESQNISYTTRIYSLYYDILLGLKNPFGVGRLQIENEISKLVSMYGYKINARTSTISTVFAYYGAGIGIFYLYLWIKACYRFAKRDLGNFVLIFIIIFMILNSEPMLYHIFFTCVLFYWFYTGKANGDRKNNAGKLMEDTI